MSEFRKVEIVSANMDFASSVICILRSVTTTLVAFLLAAVAGLMLGEKAIARLTGKPESEVVIEIPLAVLSIVTLFLSVVAIYVVTEYCYGRKSK